MKRTKMVITEKIRMLYRVVTEKQKKQVLESSDLKKIDPENITNVF